ncbi:hypothetical protein DesfrDRAFT_3572 [Solidesulfovibrio fructosivorans JJ]]|uniref:Uncharacterized protein n=1 Tax=Solidesulfovibrio fructosivorans JJ] TaxID=596151 RepID=E1K122_SOLFR|nr:hypothetical protein [Solidesulfovibrio fructosivorans]EFL49718.1 hypothetical protein DesfrDRAFT_3572 [Solidesulfovibrio fructosivorans JJ]]
MLSNDSTGVTRVIEKGFGGIEFPPDLAIKENTSCDILLIGLGPFFSKPICDVLHDKRANVNILFTLDQDVVTTRGKSIKWEKSTYTNIVHDDSYNFIVEYRDNPNIKYWLYKIFPFGLYLRVENYCWFTPLWNTNYSEESNKVVEAGSAVFQRTIEIKTDSYMGRMLDINYKFILKSAENMSAQDLEKSTCLP